MEDGDMLSKRLDMFELKLDVIIKELVLSRSEEKYLVSGMDILLEELRKRKDMDRVENKMGQNKCTIVDMLTKVNGGGKSLLL